MKGFIIFENFNKIIECKEVIDGTYISEIAQGNAFGTFTGTIDQVSEAKCNEGDKYDFETGALIALMKMCGSDKVVRACNEAFSEDIFKTYATKYERELNTLKKDFDKVRDLKDFYKKNYEEVKEHYRNLSEENITLKKENEELKKNIDELFESEQHSKTELGRLYFEKHRLEEKVEKLKLDCEKLQHGYIDTDMIFCGGRQNGKQYTLLADLFKKLDQKKVDAAYEEAYNTTLPVWQKEALRQAYEIRKIEASKYSLPHVHEWLYRIPTKRDEMWDEIFELHKENDVIFEVKKENVTTFLHELENRFPEITWASGVKIFETKYTIKDVYFELKTCDIIYFRLSRETKLSYSDDPHIYQYRELKHIDYLPPMRWDLFKKGRIIVKVNYHNYEDFYNKCEIEIGRKPHYTCEGTFTVYYSKGVFHTRPYKDDIPFAKKIVNWEDVR